MDMAASLPKAKTARNGKIEFMRFVMAVMVVLRHSATLESGSKLFLHGSLAVEFFFLVSGYLMAASCAKKQEPPTDIGGETVQFLLKKIAAFFPTLVISQIVFLAMKFITAPTLRISQKIQLVLNAISSSFLLDMTGYSINWEARVCWYLSAMVIAMFLLYPICRTKYRTFTHIIAPLTGTMIVGMFFVNRKTFLGPTDVLADLIYAGLPRGIAEICLGAVAYELTMYFRKIELTKFGQILVSLLELGVYASSIFFMQHYFAGTDVAVLYMLMVGIICSFSHKGLFADAFDNKCCYWLGKYSLALYLSHVYWVSPIARYCKGMSFNRKLVLYLVLSVISSLITQYLADWIRKVFPKVKKLVVAQ